MGMFSRAIDEHGNVWQFKTGHDDLKEYRIGDPVPYFFNEKLAHDVRWEDDIYEGWLETRGDELCTYAFVVIKDHKLHAIEGAESEREVYQRRLEYLARFGINSGPLPEHNWSYEARLAYHKQQADLMRRLIEEENRMRAKYPDWDTKDPSRKFMLRQLNRDGFARRILPPATVSETTNN